MTPTTELPTVKLGDIAPHPRNPRHQLGDITDLTASISRIGILQPLIIVHAPTGGTPYWLIAGHRRYAAARAAALMEVPCILREDLDDPGKQLVGMLTENGQRQDLSPVEEGEAIQGLLDLPGWTVRRAATELGRPQAHIRTRTAITRLPDRIKGRIESRQITLDEATAMADHAGDRDVVARLERVAGTRDFPLVLQQAREGRDRRKAAEKLQAQLRKAGVRLVARVAHGAVRIDQGGPSVAMWGMDLYRVLHPGAPVAAADPGEVEAHASCPGHAAVDPVTQVPYGGSHLYGVPGGGVQWLCLQPELHRDPDDDVDAAPELHRDPDDDVDADERRQLADEARRQAAADLDTCETAARVRHDWIRAITSATGPLPPKQALAVAGHAVHALTDTRIEAEPQEWLLLVDHALDRDAVDELATDDIEARLCDLVGRRDPHRMLLACLATTPEYLLRNPRAWIAGHLRAYLPWLGLLTGLGYEPSTWEQEHIDAALRHIEETRPM